MLGQHPYGHRQSIFPSFTDTMFRAACEHVASVCANQIARVHGAGTRGYTYDPLTLQTQSFVTPEPCLCHVRVIVCVSVARVSN